MMEYIKKKTTTYFKQFDNCDALNEYIKSVPNDTVASWQMVKLCTGDTVILAQFERIAKTSTIINEW